MNEFTVDANGFINEAKENGGGSGEGNAALVGELTQQLPPDDLKLEYQWLAVLKLDREQYLKYFDGHTTNLKKLCRRGIPRSVRGRVWYRISMSWVEIETGKLSTSCKNKRLRDSDIPFDLGFCFQAVKQVNEQSEQINKLARSTYRELYLSQISSGACSTKHVDDIEKDLKRQFPDHPLFSELSTYSTSGLSSLKNVLLAYTLFNPRTGYCQAMAPVVGCLLMHMPEEFAFWTFVRIAEYYLEDYYQDKLLRVQADGWVLHSLLERHHKLAAKFFRTNSMDPSMYCVEWFMCLFIRTLDWPCALRVLDMFFYEGVKVLFKTAIALLKLVVTKKRIKSLGDKFELLQVLKYPPKELTKADKFLPLVASISLSFNDLYMAERKVMRERTELYPHLMTSRGDSPSSN